MPRVYVNPHSEVETVELDGELIASTDAAYLVDFGTDAHIWIPKSLCEDQGNNEWDVALWKAEKLGLV